MFEENIISLAGVGKKRAFFFNNLGIFNYRDVLFHLPYKYLSINETLEEGPIVIKATAVKKIKFSPKFFRVIVLFNDIEIFLNFYNIKFFNIFYKDQTYYLCGDLFLKDDKYYMNSPNILNVPSKIIPVYKGISSYLFSNIVLQIIEKLDDSEIIYDNYTLKKIFFNMHNGIDIEKALTALKYLEASFLYYLFNKKQPTIAINTSLETVLNDFPYKLSNDQLALCKKIELSLNNNPPLKHFVYGEVGSGKTIVAAVSILMILNAGYNAILLAPTIALAYQHYEEILKIVPHLVNEILLLTSFSKKKKTLKENIGNNCYKIIIGTHALMHLNDISNLGLIVIDEIHKFGVLQRSKLLNHAVVKNILMLTATPIPRSLSMIMGKLMDYSTLPSFKNKNVTTLWVNSENKMSLLEKCKDKKVYWIMPNIDENEKNEGIDFRCNQIKEFIPNVFMLHGRMKDQEKLEVINNFKNINHAILVATTIVEIGINIPDADIIIIENAENFGLSQLHQLRGRVGRNGQQSFCILLSKFKTKKIQYMKEYDNGFDISAKDLELRGSGKITGILQHGCTSFYFLTENDDDIFDKAAKDAKIFKAFDIFSKSNISC